MSGAHEEKTPRRLSRSVYGAVFGFLALFVGLGLFLTHSVQTNEGGEERESLLDRLSRSSGSSVSSALGISPDDAPWKDGAQAAPQAEEERPASVQRRLPYQESAPQQTEPTAYEQAVAAGGAEIVQDWDGSRRSGSGSGGSGRNSSRASDVRTERERKLDERYAAAQDRLKHVLLQYGVDGASRSASLGSAGYGSAAAAEHAPPATAAASLAEAERSARIPPRRLLPGTARRGTKMRVRLTSAVSSEAEGIVTGSLMDDVWDHYQRAVVFPKGSVFTGSVRRGGASQDGNRVAVGWTRITTPEGNVADLPESPGTSADGSGGLEGKVDRHYLRFFGKALALSAISAGIGSGRGDVGSSRNGAIYEASTSLGDATAEVIRSDLNVEPSVYVPVGTVVGVTLAENFKW